MGANIEAAKGDSTIRESDITYHELIGRGASGDVFRVTLKSQKLGKVEAAAKKIPILKHGNIIDELFGNEIKCLQSLSHPNIITYYGHVITRDHVILVTEYASNGTLYENLKNKERLHPVQKLKWAIQAAKGIKYLKDKQVLHRDIKSINLLIDCEDNLKICDFGIAKDLTSTKATKSFKGSIKYMPPEAFSFTSDSILSPKADIFAFGIVLWELETCKEPYKGLSSERIMWMVGNDDYRPEIPASCPETLRNLIQECWDRDRENRPEAEGVVARLELYESSLQWQYRHTIGITGGVVLAIHWVSSRHLAVCMNDCVKVYEVTTHLSKHRSKLVYELSSDDWKKKYTRPIGIAVSDALPDRMLVICKDKPYVYEFQCHQARREAKKYRIQWSGEANPEYIVANANTAAISFSNSNTIVICSLPDFTHQTCEQVNIYPWDISISTNNLLVMGRNEMVVKPLGDMSKDVCKIKPPDGWRFSSVCFRNDDTEIYAACDCDEYDRYGYRGCVYRYRWDASKSEYVVESHVIVTLSLFDTSHMCLSVTLGGLLAFGAGFDMKVYSLE